MFAQSPLLGVRVGREQGSVLLGVKLQVVPPPRQAGRWRQHRENAGQEGSFVVVSLWFAVRQIPTIFSRECLRKPDFIIFSQLDTPEAVTQLQDSSPDSWQVAGLEKSIWSSLGLTGFGFLSPPAAREPVSRPQRWPLMSRMEGATSVFCTKGSFQVLSTNQKLSSGKAEISEKTTIGSGNLARACWRALDWAAPWDSVQSRTLLGCAHSPADSKAKPERQRKQHIPPVGEGNPRLLVVGWAAWRMAGGKVVVMSAPEQAPSGSRPGVCVDPGWLAACERAM